MHKTDTAINAHPQQQQALSLATQILTAQIAAGDIKKHEVTETLVTLTQTISTMLIGGEATSPDPQAANSNIIPWNRPTPAVPISESVHPDYLICLEDGTKRVMLRRYLRRQHNMSVDEYRKKWNLPADYPMVAPNYTRQKRVYAKLVGLGKHQRNGH